MEEQDVFEVNDNSPLKQLTLDVIGIKAGVTGLDMAFLCTYSAFLTFPLVYNIAVYVHVNNLQNYKAQSPHQRE